MMLRSLSFFLAFGLGLGGSITAHAAALRPSLIAETSTPLAQSPPGNARVLIDAALATDRLDFGAADRLYAHAVLADDLRGALGRLDELTAVADSDRACRIAALKAVLQWRDGEIDAATAALDRCQSTDALILRGQLLDIQNQAEAASVWYERARTQSNDAPERARLDRRLAIIGVTGSRPDALSLLVASGDAGLANRAAAVLGLLGRPGDAAELYRPGSAAASRYGDAVRQAHWELEQGASEADAAWAWRAVQAAQTADDRLYALALVVEAYRKVGDLAGAEVFLAQRPRGPEVDQTRLDVLVELRRYDDAVALARQAGDGTPGAPLLNVLRAAGRMTEVEAEYRRLIREQPADPRWADGLAALYLEQGRLDQTAAVYRDLSAANRAHPEVQIETARKMIALGLSDPATAGGTTSTSTLATAVRRFEIEAAIDQGREAEAEAGLRALSAAGEGDTVALVAVAEDYERLGRQDLALETLLDAEARGGVLNDDQQAHAADLAFAAGRPEEALTRWRSLWARTELPARKVLLQRQIIRAAQQTHQLEPIAAELEDRITSGVADQGEVSLLVEIRIAQQDGEAAERAVRRYADRSRSGEVRTLEQLAAVQARLRNYAGLNASLARLAQLDPANADAYLRRLIINILRFPDPGETDADRDRRVDALMGEMRAAGGFDDAEAARFAASIYTSGHRSAEALAQHRRALALAPFDVDALLEYTAARRAAGEAAQAAGLLQFKAETAPDGAAFVAALNGLIDILTAGDANSVTPPPDLSQTRLGWGLRAALERILQDGDDVRLSSLVGDIGQDIGEPELQLRALQASLAVAGDQKPAVLRQLISLTSASESDAGDPERKAIYGRRLVAMRKPYPPEVYADLAQTFLMQGDVAGAERAFALMDDIGGLVNLAALQGEAYVEAGMAPQALANYRLALIQDQDNPDLMARTAVLLERSGAVAEASALYWRALNRLVQRRPPQRADDVPEAVDAAQLATLIEGTLRTWPEGETEARLIPWRQAVRDAVRPRRTVGGDAATARLADFPRLSLVVTVNRILATALDDDRLRTLQRELLELFRDDPDVLNPPAEITRPTVVETTAPAPHPPVKDLPRCGRRPSEQPS